MNINLVGIGLGNPELLTKAACNAISKSDIVIGAKRIVDSIRSDFVGKKFFLEYNTEKIADIIKSNACSEIAVIFSGDISLFSGGSKLFERLKAFKNCKINTFPGISSLSYLCAKTNIDISKVCLLYTSPSPRD